MDKEQLINKIREYHQFFIDMATGKKIDNFYEEYEKKRNEFIQLDQSILTIIPRWLYETDTEVTIGHL